MVDEAKLRSPICSTFEVLVVLHVFVLKRNWAYSAPGPAVGFEFLVYLINFLSIFLRYCGFTGIQKAIVDQADSRPLHNKKLVGCD